MTDARTDKVHRAAYAAAHVAYAQLARPIDAGVIVLAFYSDGLLGAASLFDPEHAALAADLLEHVACDLRGLPCPHCARAENGVATP
jgi:hypothetical protein